MFVIKYKSIFISISAVLVALAITSIFVFKMNLGIDFTGGSILEAQYTDTRPETVDINKALADAGIDGARVQPTEDLGLIVRTPELTEQARQNVLDALSIGGTYQVTQERLSSIGPTIGQELREKAWIAIVTVVLAIILFIAYVFRHVSEPVSSWKYGVIAIVALIHDIIIPTGIFAALGYEVDSLFVIALLAILGLSVNDTIVVFDRIRENLRRKISSDFPETVGKSLSQTFTRSINTSLTTLIVLLALYFVGPLSTQHFALALALGLFFGTYSSIFLASPLLVVWEKTRKK